MNISRKEKISAVTMLFLTMILVFSICLCIGLWIAKVVFNVELSFGYALTFFLSYVSYLIGYFGVLVFISFRKKHED